MLTRRGIITSLLPIAALSVVASSAKADEHYSLSEWSVDEWARHNIIPSTIDEAVVTLERIFSAIEYSDRAYEEHPVYGTLCHRTVGYVRCLSDPEIPKWEIDRVERQLVRAWFLTALADAERSDRKLLMWRVKPKFSYRPVNGRSAERGIRARYSMV